jgi:hypothetical protein
LFGNIFPIKAYPLSHAALLMRRCFAVACHYTILAIHLQVKNVGDGAMVRASLKRHHVLEKS